MKRFKKLFSFMACLAFVLVGGVALSACGEQKTDIWQNAESSTADEFQTYISQPDLDLGFSAFTSKITAKSMGISESVTIQAVTGATVLDFQAIVKGGAYTMVGPGVGVGATSYIYKGMIYSTSPAGKYCYRPYDISVLDCVPVPFTGDEFTFTEWFDQVLNSGHYVDDGNGDSTYEEFTIEIVNYKKIEQENGMKFRLETDWNETEIDSSSKYTFTFTFENKKLTQAQLTQDMKISTGYTTMNMSLTYNTVAENFTSLPLPSNLEDRTVWPEKDPEGLEYEWHDITLDEFNQRITKNELKTNISTFVYSDAENRIMRAKRGQGNEFAAEIGDAEELGYVAIKNGKMYGRHETGNFKTTPENLDKFTNLYFVNQGIKESMEAMLEEEGAQIDQWTVTSGELATLNYANVEAYTFVFEIEQQNVKKTMTFNFAFTNGELVVANVLRTVDYETKTMLILTSAPEFDFTFPRDIETWTETDEQTFNTLFGF